MHVLKMCRRSVRNLMKLECKFVDAYDSYLKSLDPLSDVLVLERTQKTYQEHLQRKLNLDFTVRLWYKDRQPERGDNHSVFSGGTYVKEQK